MIKVKKLHPDAKLPVRAFPTDAGSDLFSVETVIIPAKQRKFVDTGIALQALDKDVVILWRKDLQSNDENNNIEYEMRSYLRIAPKSGLAANKGLDVLAGVVDLAYTGSIVVGLYNTSDEDVTVNAGDKIAQLIREACFIDRFVEVDEFEATDRGDGGFGSTGA